MTSRPQLLGDFVGHDSSGTVSAKIIRAAGLRAQNCVDVIGGVFVQVIRSRVGERVVGNRTQDRTFRSEIWAKVLLQLQKSRFRFQEPERLTRSCGLQCYNSRMR